MIVPILGGRGERAAVGAERWAVEWEVLTKAAAARWKADPANYEHDRDVDEVTCVRVFATKADALAFAKKKADSGQTVYGDARVERQRVDLLDDCPYQVGEWNTVGDTLYASDLD